MSAGPVPSFGGRLVALRASGAVLVLRMFLVAWRVAGGGPVVP